MVEKFLQSEDDGLPMRKAGNWVAVKLDYVARYIDIFETAMRTKWPTRNYIDLFAGPGKCRVRQTGEVLLGSPLLALTTEHPFTGYFFVDRDPNQLSALQKRSRASTFHDRIQFSCGDSNVVVQEIAATILASDRRQHGGTPSSLNLALLDQEGLELQWETIATLARVPKMDLIIYYPQMGIARYIKIAFQSEDETAVDRFFGDTEWRKIYQAQRGGLWLHRRLIDHYKKKLQGLGYTHVFQGDEHGYEPLIRNQGKNAPLYRLLFASKHALGHKFWREVIKRDVYGQRQLPF